MTHRKLLGAMAALLFFAGGGVFVLVNQSGEDLQWAESEPPSLLAGVNVETGEKTLPAEREEDPDEQKSKPTKQIVSSGQEFQPQPSSAGLRPSPSPTVQPQKSPPKPAPEPAVSEKEESVESPPLPPLPSPSPSVSFPININTASDAELQEITGIGPALAQRIIDYRQNISLFYQIEDIKNVSGIGDVTFEKMRDEITVGNVVVPSSTPQPSSSAPPPSVPQEEQAQSGKININTAGYEELQEITGVGPVIAQRIIDYREENGSFQHIEDIKNVNGIGEVKFEKMKDEIEV